MKEKPYTRPYVLPSKKKTKHKKAQQQSQGLGLIRLFHLMILLPQVANIFMFLLWTVAPGRQNQLIHTHKHSATEEGFYVCSIVEETSPVKNWVTGKIASVLSAL